MMNRFSILLTLVFSLLLAFSCTDLEEDLVGDVTNDISIAGISVGGGGAAGGPLAGAFGKLRDGSAGHFGHYSIQEITTDEMVIGAKGGDWFDVGILIQLHQHTYDPTNGMFNNTWNQAYGGINTCNELLAGGGLDANGTAQVRALRAYFYLRLMDLFGNVKVPTSPGDDPAQSSRGEVFSFVESELLGALGISEVSASMDLSGSALGTDNNPYRINQFGALGILAKLYLNAEVYSGTARWAEADAAASYIIDSGVYQLCGAGCAVPNLGKRPAVDSDPDMLEGYAAVFAANNENNPEHIFTIEYDEVTAGGMNFTQMNLHYSSQFTYNLDAQPWNGYATLEEFYNSYSDSDARKGASFLVGPQTDFGGSAILDFAADDGDIVLNYTPQLNELAPNYLREAGARPAKFSAKLLGRPDMDNDYPIIRLGQVYLIRGEARARAAGDWNLSLPDVNLVRARAGASSYSSIDADEFLAERGREMFAESVRRTDLIRFGEYNGTWWEKPASPEHVNIFPIPFDQLQAANGTLSQNPGY
ncbi:MAG: RagB/SusD family nutrient uptake outer membrane protein [Bacteroidota bacterium]